MKSRTESKQTEKLAILNDLAMKESEQKSQSLVNRHPAQDGIRCFAKSEISDIKRVLGYHEKGVSHND